MENKDKVIASCAWCGADLKLQPSPLHEEDGKKFCNTTCAYEYRLSTQPINKILS